MRATANSSPAGTKLTNALLPFCSEECYLITFKDAECKASWNLWRKAVQIGRFNCPYCQEVSAGRPCSPTLQRLTARVRMDARTSISGFPEAPLQYYPRLWVRTEYRYHCRHMCTWPRPLSACGVSRGMAQSTIRRWNLCMLKGFCALERYSDRLRTKTRSPALMRLGCPASARGTDVGNVHESKYVTYFFKSKQRKGSCRRMVTRAAAAPTRESLSKEDLVAYIASGCKPRSSWK